MLIFLNYIMLQVSVPVLSENIYFTIPNYSFKFEDWTLVAKYLSLSYIIISHWMNWACINLTISSVTIKEIGTKLEKSKNQEKSWITKTKPGDP